MKKIAVFPGSFDPITRGHVAIVERALPLFDEVIVALGINTQKQYLFTPEKRMEWIRQTFEGNEKIKVAQFEGLTAHFCKSVGARYLLRGLRNSSDFDYEKTISQINNIVGEGLDTIFLISEPKYSHFSSTIVREVIKGNGDASSFIPEEISRQISALKR